MRRHVRTRLTACLVAAAATTALGVALAPAAQADEPGHGHGPAAGSTLLDHLRNNTSSNAPNVMTHVPPFGRKLS